MLLHKKVKAYTLSELIIVIIITSIVAGLSFSALNLVHSHMNQINKNFDYELKVKQTELQMRIHFNTYSKVYMTTTDQLVFKTYKDSLIYHFETDYFIQDSDTVPLTLVDKTYFFKGHKVESGTIDALEVTFQQSEHIQTKLFVYKENDALTILENGY